MSQIIFGSVDEYKEKRTCPSSDCRNPSFCVISIEKDNYVTDTCVYLQNEFTCSPYSIRSFNAFTHLCTWKNGPAYQSRLCIEMMVSQAIIPQHETTSNCSGFPPMSFGIYVKEKSAKISSGNPPEKNITVKNVTFYLLPLGSTIYIDDFPFHFLYMCHENVTTFYLKWLFGNQVCNCYQPDKETNISISDILVHRNFTKVNETNLIDFLIAGNTTTGYDFRTYGTFLFLPG